MTSNPSERLAPHSVEAEEAVLGAILLDNEEWLKLCTFLNEDSFYILRHSWIWQAMQHIFDRKEPVDNISLMYELRNQGHLDEVGGGAYISYLINNTTTSHHAEVYGRIVQRCATRRRLLNSASKQANYATDPTIDADEAVRLSEQSLSEVTDGQRESRGKFISEWASDVYDKVLDRWKHGQSIGISTGFTELDALLGGWQKSDFILVAARPGMGKSSLMLNCADHASRNGIRTAYFSLEMDGDQVTQRLVASSSLITVQNQRRGQLNDNEIGLFTNSIALRSEQSLYLDDTAKWHVDTLVSEIKRLVRQYSMELIFVDYLGLLDGLAGSGKKGQNENRTQEIAYISRALKVASLELKVPIVAASQLNRDLEKRADKRPMLSDLRDSGSLEQDADIVLFIYRDDMYNEDTDCPNQAEIIVAKHRNGDTGTIRLHWTKSTTTFTDLKTQHYEVPQPLKTKKKGEFEY